MLSVLDQVGGRGGGEGGTDGTHIVMADGKTQHVRQLTERGDLIRSDIWRLYLVYPIAVTLRTW